MELIIISGPARVGKTTLANMIAKQAFDLGLIPTLKSFVDPLRKEAESRGYFKDKNPIEYREFCQTHGALKREIDPDYWVKVFEEDLAVLYEQEVADLKENKTYWERCVIVDDCRYENELSLGIKYRGKRIFLHPGTRKLEDWDADWRKHHSEKMARDIINGETDDADLFDYILMNDSNKEHLEGKVDIMAPVWCGTQTFENIRKNPKYVAEVIDEMIDFLIFPDSLEDDDEYEY